MNRNIGLFLGIFSILVLGQEKDSILVLSPLEIESTPNFEVGHSVHKIALTEPIRANALSLSQVLEQQEAIPFKNYGNGLLSSISYRGLSSTHTATYWNDLPINSSMNGQLDFNLLPALFFEELSFRKGGGSALLGSGNVGGSISLKSEHKEKEGIESSLLQSFGSYNTYNTMGAVSFHKNRWSAQIRAQYFQSENDYEVPSINGRQALNNAALKSQQWTTSLQYQWNSFHSISINQWSTWADRELPGTYFAPYSEQSQKDQSHRIQLVYKGKIKNFDHSIQLAYFNENFRYYANASQESESKSVASNYIGQFLWEWKLPQQWTLSGKAYSTYIQGESVNFGSPTQWQGIISVNAHKKISNTFELASSFQKGFSDEFSIPFTFDMGINYVPWKHHTFFGNFTTNYRTPTLNDLYWDPGGNPNLQSENGWMSDLGYRWKNNSKPFHLEASVYYGRFKDWIQWQPNSLGLWQPFNILKVKTYGLESTASWQKEWKDWKTKISATYSYNISENEDTQKQLIYTPKNNVSIRSQFDFNKWFLSFFYTYHSSRFTTSNNSQSLEGNGISQLNLGYQTSALKLPISTIFSIQNVSNLEYESVKGYYMPGRNYQLSCQLKF